MSLRSDITTEASKFPFLPPRAARRQAKKLIRAKRYLQRRGIQVDAVGSDFKYQPLVGTVLL